MDKQNAEEIAMRFFEQHHDVHNVKAIIFENGVWVVEGELSSSFGASIRKLRIDAKTGRIVNLE